MGTIKKIGKNVKDTITEGMHHGEAQSEREKRATMGEIMTPRQKTESAVHEVSEESKAGIDRVKRDVRNI